MVDEGTDYPLVHGSLMLLAFGFLAPAGTFVARYLKTLGTKTNEYNNLFTNMKWKGHPWYLIHITIQYIVLALTISAFVIIESDIGSSRHFDNPHAIIGLTVVILTLIQVCFFWINSLNLCF